MSWGSELWDQYENISYHTNKGIDFLDKYGSFVKERCAIEIEYASKLRRLVKNHQYKKKDENDSQFTYIKAFVAMLQEIIDLAGQHELIAENMCSEITNEICTLVKELKEERKRYLADGQKLQYSLHDSYLQLDKSKKYYEKAFKDAERAHEHFEKVDADLNLSRAEVEKARSQSLTKTQLADKCKSEYATNLQKTNDMQRTHFNEAMPRVFNQLQEMEQRRIHCTQNFILLSAKIQVDVFPIINKCLQGIIKASEMIDAKKDCDFVIERYKSGNEPPGDLPFEDLSNPQSNDTQSNNSVSAGHSLHYSNSITGKDTIKGTLVYAKFKKRAGIFNFFGSNKQNNDDLKEEIYADLPPVQRRKRIQEKLNGIQEQLKQETNVKDGLMKMKQAYQDNPDLGDPNSLDSQIKENSRKLEKLQLEEKKFEGYLLELNGKSNPGASMSNNGSAINYNNNSTNVNHNNSSTNITNFKESPNSLRRMHRASLSEYSLSRSGSDSSVSHKPGQLNGNRQIDEICIPVLQVSGNVLSNNKHNLKNNGLNGCGILNNMSSASSNADSAIVRSDQGTSSIISGEQEKTTLDWVDYIDGDKADIEEEEEFNSDLGSIGKAVALYKFEPLSECAIPMAENQVFEVVELDEGDGWTRVRNKNLEEGFVPTSYLEIELNIEEDISIISRDS